MRTMIKKDIRCLESSKKADFKLSPKQEAFAVAVASGSNLSDAYRKAGYSCGTMKTVNEAASRLKKNSKITARIEALRKPIAKHAQITLESHLEELKRIRDKAVELSQFSVAISAEVARGKASGLYVTKTEINSNLEIQNMSSAELKDNIMELLIKSGRSSIVI